MSSTRQYLSLLLFLATNLSFASIIKCEGAKKDFNPLSGAYETSAPEFSILVDGNDVALFYKEDVVIEKTAKYLSPRLLGNGTWQTRYEFDKSDNIDFMVVESPERQETKEITLHAILLGEKETFNFLNCTEAL